MSILLYAIGGISMLIGFLILAPQPEPSNLFGLWIMAMGFGTAITGHVVGLMEEIRDAVTED